MIPRGFQYIAPSSIETVIEALATHGESAKVMAGGQSLLAMMKLRLATPQIIVDLWKVPGLSDITSAGEYITIGSRATHYDVETSEVLKAKCPLLAEAASLIGDPQVRNLGTIGGSLAHADPSADYPPVLVALGASIKMRGPSGERTIKAEDFFVNMFVTNIAADELITEVQVPVLPPGTGASYVKFRRRYNDFGIVTVAVVIPPSMDSTVAASRVVLGSVTSKPVRARHVEEALTGQRPDAVQLAEASQRAIIGLESSFSDAEFRLRVTPVNVKRALEIAYSRLQ